LPDYSLFPLHDALPICTDMQMLSPRPFQMMHSAKPGKLVHWFTEETNNIIARTAKLLPRFVPVAGLPQVAGEPIENSLAELERCVRMGFRGTLDRKSVV